MSLNLKLHYSCTFTNGYLHTCILSPQKLHRSTGSWRHQTTFRQFIHAHYPARPPRPVSTPHPNQPANSRINGLRVGLTWTTHISKPTAGSQKTNLNPPVLTTLKSQPPQKYLQWTKYISPFKPINIEENTHTHTNKKTDINSKHACNKNTHKSNIHMHTCFTNLNKCEKKTQIRGFMGQREI